MHGFMNVKFNQEALAEYILEYMRFTLFFFFSGIHYTTKD